MTSNEYLANLTRQISQAPLSSGAEEEIRYKLLDWLGCAIGGAACQKPASFINQRAKVENGATIIGSHSTGTPTDAALCNAFSASYLEFDDTHKVALSHPGAPNIAAAIAVCESEDTTFQRLFCAIIAGYEVMLRLGAAINPSHYETWHTTGTCGIFGATSAACLGYGLDTDSIARALGIAANMSTGFRFAFGTDAKTACVAHASMCGILAADMAKIGFSGPEEILDHALLPIMSRVPSRDALIEQDRRRPLWRNCAYKSYASCGHTHTALDCWNLLITEHNLSADEIAEVTVTTFSVAKEATGSFKHADSTQARFSIPYCFAVALLVGEVTPKVFSLHYLDSPEVIELAEKIVVTASPEFDAMYPLLRPAQITVRLKSGKTLEKSLTMSVTNPPRKFLRQKYHALTDPVIGPDTAQTIEALILEGDCQLPVRAFTTILQEANFTPNQAIY